MTYRGIVRGNVIEMKGAALLPDGTEVEVIVKRGTKGADKGSPGALVAALKTPPRCTPEEVELLLRAMDQGKRPVRFTGPFEKKRIRK